MKVKLVIDRIVSNELAEMIWKLLPHITDADIFEFSNHKTEISKEAKQEDQPKTITANEQHKQQEQPVKEEPPQKPIGAGEPVIVPIKRPIGRPKVKTRLELIDDLFSLLIVKHPDWEDSIQLLRETFAWEEDRVNWIPYGWSEVSNIIVLEENYTKLLLNEFYIAYARGKNVLNDPNVYLPITLDNIAKQLEDENAKRQSINQKQTGDPHIGFGEVVLNAQKFLDRKKAEFLLTKLDWSSARKIFITYEQFLTWLGYPFNMSNVSTLSWTIKKEHPEWNFNRKKKWDSRLHNTVSVYGFPPPVVMDPKHPFPGM